MLLVAYAHGSSQVSRIMQNQGGWFAEIWHSVLVWCHSLPEYGALESALVGGLFRDLSGMGCE